MTEKNLTYNCVMAVNKKVTPLQAIRQRCVNCAGFDLREVRECMFDGVRESLCLLYALRMGRGSRSTLRRIRDYCIWCCNGLVQEVRLCPSVKCPLWPYRFGKRPLDISLNASDLSEISSTEGVSELDCYGLGCKVMIEAISK